MVLVLDQTNSIFFSQNFWGIGWSLQSYYFGSHVISRIYLSWLCVSSRFGMVLGSMEFSDWECRHPFNSNFYTFQQVQHLNFDAPFVILEIFICASQMFLYCYFGQLATDSFQNLDDFLFDLNWFNFSIEQQKCINLILLNSQKPLIYHGFGIVKLDLQSYTKVTKTRNRFSLMCSLSIPIIYFSSLKQFIHTTWCSRPTLSELRINMMQSYFLLRSPQ